MTRLNRNGFTLVELLVVIVIITMLVGLLISAVGSSRERARQAQCTNNQREIALAVLQYETAKKQFPGYVNRFGTTPVDASSGFSNELRPPLSWATVILPHLNHEAAWREWRALRKADSSDTSLPGKAEDLGVRMPQYVCPSDSESQQDKAALSYVVNCGVRDVSPPDTAANGVFHNRYRSDSPVVSSSSIRDGSSQTIMLSENIQAGYWYADVNPANSYANEYNVGINWVWINYSSKTNPVEQPSSACSLINNCRDVNQRPSDALYARPSSNHPGLVIVTYCDGHQQSLSERISYVTYQQLMAPEDKKAGDGTGLPTLQFDSELLAQ